MISLWRRVACIVASLTLAVAVLAVPASADVGIYEHTALTWTPARATINDTTASGGTAIKLDDTTAGVMASEPLGTITVRARGDACWNNEFPVLRVSVGTTVLGTATVSAGAWTPYPFTVPTGVTGPVKVELTNGFVGYFWGGVCYRSLYVDTVTTTAAAGSSPTSTPTTTTPPPPSTEYVAMGDSYSSGDGSDRTPASPTRNDAVYSGGACYRSSNAAAVLLAARRGLTLTHVACDGATTANILTTGQNGEPAQITRLTPNTALVTMTIGGNDTSLLGLGGCVLTNGDCTPGNWGGLWFSPQAQYGAANTAIDGLGAKVGAILRQVAVRSPNARVVIAGYPYIISGPGEAPDACSSVVTAWEATSFNTVLARENAVVKAAVQAVSDELGKDYRFADPLANGSPFMERLAPNAQLGDGCSTSTQRWMNGYGDTQYGSWHPNIYGQQRYADLYDQALG